MSSAQEGGLARTEEVEVDLEDLGGGDAGSASTSSSRSEGGMHNFEIEFPTVPKEEREGVSLLHSADGVTSGPGDEEHDFELDIFHLSNVAIPIFYTCLG